MNDCPICKGLGVVGGCGYCGTARKPTESNPMVRFRDGKHTRSAAIKAMCAHCMVRDCTSVECPLHEFRPFQRSDADDETDAQ